MHTSLVLVEGEGENRVPADGNRGRLTWCTPIHRDAATCRDGVAVHYS